MSRGHICPTIEAETIRQGYLLRAIRAKGLSLHRVHSEGKALRLTGPGVFVIAAGLGFLSEADLEAPSAGELHARRTHIQRG